MSEEDSFSEDSQHSISSVGPSVSQSNVNSENDIPIYPTKKSIPLNRNDEAEQEERK